MTGLAANNQYIFYTYIGTSYDYIRRCAVDGRSCTNVADGKRNAIKGIATTP